ncbi:MAG: M6 family metalloprotease domain-containing protein [Candidatus Delongbacteria bacterium]|nr:M6 family metalloprotease domain-containing protein [Candidatus Delongbacteria bacterium]MBN2834922.1 M6 family metalloprotease domain-containing protein [Candidatus Delongbacteria bacterium]
MKVLILLSMAIIVYCAPVFNQKIEVNIMGESKVLYQSGDEYINYLHDEDGYPIYYDADGVYKYFDCRGKTDLMVWSSDPEAHGLHKGFPYSEEEYQKIKSESFYHVDNSKGAPHEGTINAIAIAIKFNDQPEFTISREVMETIFNDESNSQFSVNGYYSEISYGKLSVDATIYPDCGSQNNLSYTDDHPRNYYLPYSASNTVGFQSIREGRLREHTLIKNAVEFISSEIPSNLDIDGDNDGYADYLCLMIRGEAGPWGDVGLWAHSGVLDSYDVSINGARFYNYSLQPESLINPRVICHELFHVLGAPDLYCYTNNFNPVGGWDIMASGSCHMGAWMKHKYSKGVWIDQIPEISQSGTYTLESLKSGPNAYKIRSPYTENEFFIIENRFKDGLYEGNLPKSGLTISRIVENAIGNGYSPPFEIYYYRNNGSVNSNGNINNAAFSLQSGMTEINDYTTNPFSFLSDGSEAGLFIENIGNSGEMMSFEVYFPIVELLSPASNSVFSNTNNLNFSVNVSESDLVEYFIDDVKIGESTTSPYGFEYALTNIPNGEHIATVHSTYHNIVSKDTHKIYITDGRAMSFFSNIDDWQSIDINNSLNIEVLKLTPESPISVLELYVDDILDSTIDGDYAQVNPMDYGFGTKVLKLVTSSANGDQFEDIKTVNFVDLEFYEGFENEWLPQGWSVSSNVYGWYRSKTSPYKGEYSLCTRNYHAQGEVTITSPPLIPDDDSILSFWWIDQSVDVTKVIGADTTYCEISVDNVNWNVVATLSAQSIEFEYHKENISLSPWSGSEIRFRFRDVGDESLDAQGTSIDEIRIFKGSTDIDENMVSSFSTILNYPNPFNPETTIVFESPYGNIFSNLYIFNSAGELVDKMGFPVNKGENTRKIDLSNLTSGVYFYQIKSSKFNSNLGRMVLLK